MDNQHRKIVGYRDLNQVEIDLINEVKGLGQQIEGTINKLQSLHNSEAVSIDPRWLSIGRTDLQTGLMALTRSVAKPDFF